MSRRPTGYISGDWLIRCDVCGFIIMASESKHKWDGAICCKECWEPRHPQELLRIRKDRIVPPFIRPENEGTFPPAEFDGACGRTARAGFAIAGCAVSGTI